MGSGHFLSRTKADRTTTIVVTSLIKDVGSTTFCELSSATTSALFLAKPGELFIHLEKLTYTETLVSIAYFTQGLCFFFLTQCTQSFS